VNAPINITITWTLIRNILAGFAGTIVFLILIGGGAVWALEKHFDDRYIIVADSLKGELRKIEREIRHLKANGGDPAEIEFLEQQRDEIKQDIDNS